jgi:hypothetical protein
MASIIRGILPVRAKLTDEDDDQYRGGNAGERAENMCIRREMMDRAVRKCSGATEDDETDFGRNTQADGSADGAKPAVHINVGHG